jgi:hypothetical protein
VKLDESHEAVGGLDAAVPQERVRIEGATTTTLIRKGS